MKKADSLTQILSSASPAANLAKCNYYWWQIISGNKTEETVRQYHLLIESTLKALPRKEPARLSNEDLYSYIIAYAYRARIEGLNRNYVKGMTHINNCIGYIEASLGKESAFGYFKLTSGLFNYYISTAGKQYPYLIPYLIFLPGGDESKGLRFLNDASENENDPALQTEATYFLMKIHMEKSEWESAYRLCRKLVTEYPSNLLFQYYHYKIILDWRGEKEARPSLIRLKQASYSEDPFRSKAAVYFYKLAEKDLKSSQKKL